MLLPILFYGLLHINFVQQYLVNRVTVYFSEELQTEVSVGGVDVRFFRSVILYDVRVLDRQQEVLLDLGRLDLHLQHLSVPQKKLALSEIHFRQLELGMYKKAEKDVHNFRFILDYFSRPEPANDQDRWHFSTQSLRISDAAISYQDHNFSQDTQGFNYHHFKLADLNLAIHDIHLTDALQSLRIDQVQFSEDKGFQLDQLAASLKLKDDTLFADHFMLEAGQTALSGNMALRLDAREHARDVIDQVRGQISLQPGRIDLADIGHYYQPFFGIRGVLHAGGQVYLGDRHIEARDISLEYGPNTAFYGEVMLSRLDSENDLHVEARIDQLRSSINDIQGFDLPEASASRHFELPAYLEKFGDIHLTGTISGNRDDLLAEGEMRTSLGHMESEISLTKDDYEEGYHYRGKIITKAFQLGSILGRDGYPGDLNMQAEVSGSGFAADGLRMHLDGYVDSTTMGGVLFTNIDLEGEFMNQRFDGRLQVNDEKLNLSFNGLVDFDTDTPAFQFQMGLVHANLTDIGIFQRDTLYGSLLGAEVDINAKASSMDDMEGELTIRNIWYSEIPLDPSVRDIYPTSYSIDSIYVNNTRWSEENRHLRLRSDFADIDMHGNLRFEKFLESLRLFAANYSPNLKLTAPPDLKDPAIMQDIDFSFRFKDTRLLTALFMPGLEISSGSWINGSLSSDESHLELEGHADKLEIAGRAFYGYQLKGYHDADSYVLAMESERLMLSENRIINHFSMINSWKRDSIRSELTWGGDEAHHKGRVKGLTYFYDEHRMVLSFPESEAQINGNTWRFNTDHSIILDTNRVEIHQLMAYHDNQFIKADGVLSPDSEDRMGLSFSNFDAGYSDVLLGERNFNFGGLMDGYVTFTGIYQSPGIAAEFSIEDFSFNHVLMGDLEVSSSWDEEKQAFEVCARIHERNDLRENEALIATGNFYTGSDADNFDLDIILHNFKMDVWGRYLQSFTEGFGGFATGELRLDGPFNQPQLSGQLKLSDIVMPIPFLKTTYTFDHEAVIEKDRFIFEQVMLYDTLGNTAQVSGVVAHDYFRNFAIDFELRPEEMIIFNTNAADNNIFFGTAFFTGFGRIHGPTDDITMDVSARTERGTRVMLPLNYTGDVRERHFISFVSPDETESENDFILSQTGGNLTMNLDLEVTPDAEVELFFDAQFGDIIRGQGSGDLNLEIAPDGSFNIYGDYLIESGEYLFSLQNIINKRFRIDQGSSIRWTGDINDADVDLRAVYRLRTSLYELLAGGGVDNEMANQFRRRVPVETVLILEDKLFNPRITFDIDVPGGDDNTRELIEREITTDQEMNRQVFSLLVLNRFMPRDQYAALGYGMGTTSSELLSHQLSSWLSQISSDFDIGVNYRPGDEITSQEVELALSTQLFDDRVLIDGNFGVAGNQTATGHQAQGANQIIGDVNVEVKVTPEGKFRVKAFNRSNAFDIIHTNAPYTQGIGVFYRREFDQLHDFFRRQRTSSSDANAGEDDNDLQE